MNDTNSYFEDFECEIPVPCSECIEFIKGECDHGLMVNAKLIENETLGSTGFKEKLIINANKGVESNRK